MAAEILYRGRRAAFQDFLNQMTKITIVGAGMMGSAMCFPCRDNGHETRLVGTPYDREVIDRIRQDNFHLNLNCLLPDGFKAYQFEQLD